MSKNADGKEKKTPKKRGRPTIYTEELANKICEAVAKSPYGIDRICADYDEFPSVEAVKEWRQKYPAFGARYLDSKRAQAQILVEDIDTLMPMDLIYYQDDKGSQRIDSPSASLMIAKANNRKWMAARLAPKIYGDQHRAEELGQENEKLKAELAKLRAELDEKYQKEY